MPNEHTIFRVDRVPLADLCESGLEVGGITYAYRDTQIQKLFVGSTT